jgi:transcriptional regulator with PAS, ATPase and Fis domain
LYALTICTIQVPSLRDRLEDLPLIAQQMLEDRNRLLGTRLEGFETRVIQAFEKYQWPGNLRELAVVVNEAGENATGETVSLDALPFRFRAGWDAQRTGPPVASVRQSLDDYLLQVERERIREVMELVQGNKTAAAELLGIPRPKLYRRLESLGLLDAQASIAEPLSAADIEIPDEPE